jgi:hypothetical protein
MNASAIAKALGGDVVSRRQVVAPGPGHSPADRSLCITLNPDAPNGFRCHSFSGDDWKECRDHIKARLGITRDSIVVPTEHDIQVSDDDAKLLKARHLWSCRKPAIGSPVEIYLHECRGYGADIPDSIAFLPAGTYSAPAMIARFGAKEEIPGIHLTFLRPDGSGKAELEWLDGSKMMLGPSKGWPIVVSEGNDRLGMAVTEGIEDGLAIYEATGLCVWAAGSASRLPALDVPSWVETLTICVDGDDAGKSGARRLAESLAGRDIEILLVAGAQI